MRLKNLFVLINQESGIKREEHKIGNIIVPVTVGNISRQRWGKVVQVGEGTKAEPMELKVGDRVSYMHEEGRIEIDGNLLMKQQDIMFVDEE